MYNYAGKRNYNRKCSQVIRPLVLSDYCLKCQGCCRFQEENSIWSPHLLKSEKHFPPASRRKNSLKLIPQNGLFYCYYYETTKKCCRTYRRRPFECRIYPFLFCRKENDYYIGLDPQCPLTEEKFFKPRLEAFKKYLFGLSKKPGFKMALISNPHLFQDYPKVKAIFPLELK